jgi:hypothetical protein
MRALTFTLLLAAAAVAAAAPDTPPESVNQYDEAVGGGRGPWDAVVTDPGAKVSTDVVKDPRDPACYDCALLGSGARPEGGGGGGSGVRAPAIGGTSAGSGAVASVGGPQLAAAAPAPAPAGARRRGGRLVTGG